MTSSQIYRHHCSGTKSLLFVIALILALGCSEPKPPEVEEAYRSLPDEIDFNLHIRPILSDRCFACHGPDNNTRKADLRLDLPEAAFAKLKESEGFAIVPGKLSGSMVYQRMISHNPEEKMPPPESNLTVTPAEIATIAKWIEQGATYKEHWAFIPPVMPSLPKIEETEWPINEIDHFILSALTRNKLKPSEEADREMLIRRVSLDLTGLPPSLDRVDRFINDTSPDAYEKLVDELLASDEYAERMTMEWMDVARYADSHGLHADGWRMMWPWRDWVIRAFRENMPYDRFILEQLAGDMLPNASRDQKLASAFHRNHAMTAEGGIVDEEFRLEYVFDRTNTTAKAFMGLTLECARCHDHKFDPVSQQEYFQLASFFNNVKELGMTGDDGNYGPMLLLPSEKEEQHLAELDKALLAIRNNLRLTKEHISKTVDFVEALGSVSNFNPDQPVVHFPLEKSGITKNKKGKSYRYLDNNRKTKIIGQPEFVEGKVGKAIHITDEHEFIEVREVGLFDVAEPYAVSVWIKQDTLTGKTQTIIGTVGDKNQFWRGWELFLDVDNHPTVRLIHSPPHNYLEVKSKAKIPLDQWTHIVFSYNGTGKAEGVTLFVNGESTTTTIPFDQLYKTIRTTDAPADVAGSRPIRIAKSYRAFTGDNGAYRGVLDDIRIFREELTALEVSALYASACQQNRPAPEQFEKNELLDHFLARLSGDYGQLLEQYRKVLSRKVSLLDTVDEVMVMEEMPEPRITFVLDRGSYESPQEPVEAGTPKHVLPFPENLPKNRLGLAQWLTDSAHPLTARVTVNRYWQLLFGKGLVATPHDFGNQGELPSHPMLLDWLAVDFQENGWDIKRLIRQIVMSATYRQSSIPSAHLMAEDPSNRLYSRFPAYRLPAEMIRDNALFASGLLKKRVGGPSVKPYQPEGLWIEKGNFSKKLMTYQPDRGDDLYRRSLYTFIRRTSPPPAMTAFDAPGRDICTVQREQTNTPLQALVLMNDPQFVEAARVLAQNLQTNLQSLEKQLYRAFRSTTGIRPSEEEVEVLENMYQKAFETFTKDPRAAKKMLSVGEYPIDQSNDAITTAALMVVTNTLMNHDGFYMKR